MTDLEPPPPETFPPPEGATSRLPPWPDELLAKRDLWAAVGFLNGAPVPPLVRARELRRYAAVVGLTPSKAHYASLGVTVRPE